MKAIKITASLIMIIAVLVITTGCLFGPGNMLEVYPSNVIGVIEETFTDEEFSAEYHVVWSVSAISGSVAVSYGDGIAETIIGDGVVLIEHTYTKAGYYEASFLCSGRTGKATVSVVAIEYELFDPFWTQGQMVGTRETILFDPFPRIIHCNNEDSYKTGVWLEDDTAYMIPGPFGDMYDPGRLSAAFEMKIYVTTTDGGIGWAYGKDGEVISGQWVSLQTYRVIADWEWAKPPYPLQVLQKGCDDSCFPPYEPDVPWEQPDIPEGAKSFIVRQETRQVSGGHIKAIQKDLYIGGEECE